MRTGRSKWSDSNPNNKNPVCSSSNLGWTVASGTDKVHAIRIEWDMLTFVGQNSGVGALG
eukprot:scaffold449268_cov16-Prasinocladus_malaysianus.AAC.1